MHLTQDFNRVAHADSTSKIVLSEIGPRMELELVKVEEGMCDGRVLYRACVQKSARRNQDARTKEGGARKTPQAPAFRTRTERET